MVLCGYWAAGLVYCCAGTELQGYKDSQEVARLLGELESEKERNRQLEDQLRHTTRNNKCVVERDSATKVES